MDPVQKALWFVESHLADELALDDIAKACAVSPHHLTRAFAAVTGRSVMRYLRVRRLSEAARALGQGAPDILSVALEAGYGSHEAFSRAFRDQFGVTPEQVRARRHLDTLSLEEPIIMDNTELEKLDAPRFETSRPLLVAGLAERYHCEAMAGIPAQWQRFHMSVGTLPGQIGQTAYGVSYNHDGEGNMDYLCGVEVRDFSELPAGVSHLRIAEQTYAIFTSRDHISSIRSAFATILGQWLSASGRKMADAPILERYGAAFNPQTGMGGYEIWVPIKA